MRVERLLGTELLGQLIADVTDSGSVTNIKSEQLSHTEIMKPSSKNSFRQATKLITPRIAEFGTQLFGELLEWSVKEIWVNFLETGGSQAIHTHANSFISGVIYLTASHPSANLVFHKNLGGTDFIFTNQNKNVRYGPYNGNKWMMPVINAGDLVLFPSYMLHEVPINRGDRRISIAFNAIPSRLESFGYAIKFS
jgi:uncharacterized protein (TIGR02466 family)